MRHLCPIDDCGTCTVTINEHCDEPDECSLFPDNVCGAVTFEWPWERGCGYVRLPWSKDGGDQAALQVQPQAMPEAASREFHSPGGEDADGGLGLLRRVTVDFDTRKAQ